MHIATRRLTLAMLLALFGCGGDSLNGPAKNIEEDGKWPIAKPADVGISQARLDDLVHAITSTPDHEVHAILVIRHGELVFEKYFPGHDFDYAGPNFHGGLVDWGADDLHRIFSVTKAITGLIVGIAVDKGYIPSADTPVFDFFPEYAALRTPAKNQITLAHLLIMSSGLEWDETSVSYGDAANDFIRFLAAPDPFSMVLGRPLVSAPGTNYTYNGGTINVAGAVVAKTTSMSLFAFAQTHLFTPLGITDVDWGRLSSGYDEAAAELVMRPRDLAKLGYLILNGGMWNGEQIISSEWIQQSTHAYLTGAGVYGRGYVWGVGDIGGHAVIQKGGWGRQVLAVFPDLDMVVVTAGGDFVKKSPFTPLYLFRNYIVPAAE